jgi:cytochrome c-type biogenesis protein CcmH/NrfF
MRLLWWIPVAVVAAAAGLLALARRRRDDEVTLTNDPVSADWLARARGRDDHPW